MRRSSSCHCSAASCTHPRLRCCTSFASSPYTVVRRASRTLSNQCSPGGEVPLVADVLVPQLVAIDLAGRRLAEDVEQVAGDRARLAFADTTVVDLDDRHDLGGGAGEERFVGEVEVRAHHRRFDYLVTLVLRDGHDRLPGETGEYAVDQRRR